MGRVTVSVICRERVVGANPYVAGREKDPGAASRNRLCDEARVDLSRIPPVSGCGSICDDPLRPSAVRRWRITVVPRAARKNSLFRALRPYEDAGRFLFARILHTANTKTIAYTHALMGRVTVGLAGREPALAAKPVCYLP